MFEAKSYVGSRISVHDHGYVELVDLMVGDPMLKIVDSARVSFGRQAGDELTERDLKLIKYLLDHEHTSPLRHSHFSFRVRAPIFVARQLVKHQVGVSWNEESARYTEVKDEFFVPEVLRTQNTIGNKQGSGGAVADNEALLLFYNAACQHALDTYHQLLSRGVAREQARAVLPQAMYTTWVWTLSLQAVLHMLRLRLDEHAQAETRDYAKAVYALLQPVMQHLFDMMELPQ